MNSPSPPPAPDPVATAQAQGTINKDTAISQAQLNMVNQNGPGGSSSYNQIGTYGDGTPRFEQNVSLSPAQQALYDSQNKIQQSALNLGQGAIGKVQSAIDQPFDTSKLPGQVFGVNGGNPIQYGIGDQGSYQAVIPGQHYQSSVDGQKYQTDLGPNYQGTVPGQQYQTGVSGQNYQTGLGPDYSTNVSGQNYQTDLGPNYRGTVAGSQDYAGNVKSVQDALMARLDPQIEQDRTRLETRLANQGITAGTSAYDRAVNLNEQGVNDQRTQALLAASGEQSRLAGLDLAAGNFANNSAINAGNFTNNARGQQFQTDLAAKGFANDASLNAGNFANNAKTQQFQTDLAQGNFSNTAKGQQFQTDLSQGDFANSAAINAGNFGNTAKGQQFQTDLSVGNFGNSAKGQQFQTDLARGTFGNSVVSQQIQDALQKAGFNNTAQQQSFDQNMSNANLNNSGRASGIQELAYNRSQPINELASLMGFSPGVQVPNFQNTSATGIAPADYQGAVAQKYAGDMQAYQIKQQAQNAMLGAIFGAVGTAGGAGIMKSDRRLKTNIRRIGTADNGLPIYSYEYKDGGPTQIGFMADEVEKVKPWAVVERGGYKHVNYSMAVA